MSGGEMDNEHAFKARFVDSGLTFLYDRVVKQGWKTFADFAHATSWSPGRRSR